MNKTKLNKQFILASGSKRRLDLLKQISVKPDLVLTPDINETNHSKELPLDYVRRMSVEKNKVFQSKYSNSIILTADTVVSLGRRILPKTVDLEMAEECLKLISGLSLIHISEPTRRRGISYAVFPGMRLSLIHI